MSDLGTVSDLRHQLEQVDKALEAARQGESYSVDGTSFTRQSLEALRDERTRIVRSLRQVEAALEGARNPGVQIASWYR